MSILVTRPEPGANRTVAALEEKGLYAISCPLFRIMPSEVARPSGKFAALLVTSGHGAAGLTPATADLPANLPVFAVGDRTAAAMTDNGFSNVTSASGDQKALTRLVLAKLSPRFRVLLATGEDHKDGLPAAFAEAGHEIALWLRYRAEPVDELPGAAQTALAAGSIEKVLHYSRRASETFIMLSDKAGLNEVARPIQHIALSGDVAEPLYAAGFTNVAVASHPDEDHMLALASGSEHSATEDLTASAVAIANVTPRTRKLTSGRTVVQSTEKPIDVTSNQTMTGLSAPVIETTSSGDETARPSSAPVAEPVAGPVIEAAAQPINPAPIVQPQAVKPRGFGFGALIATALASGLVGAGAISFLAPMLGQIGINLPQPAANTDVAARLAKLEAPRPVAGAAELQAAIQSALQSANMPASPRVNEQLIGLDRRIGGLEARPQAGSNTQDNAAQTAAIAELHGKITEVERATQAITPRLAAVEQVARTVGVPSASATGAAKLIVADRLARALSEGRAFAMEMSALTVLGSASEPMRVLGSMSAAGAPKLEDISAEFRKLRPVFAAEPASPDAPWSERLLKLTDGLVRVRSTGAVQGSSPVAVASRIDQALQRGDSAAAAAAFNDLPEPARRAGEGWIGSVRQRASADQAIKTITEDAIKALSAQK